MFANMFQVRHGKSLHAVYKKLNNKKRPLEPKPKAFLIPNNIRIPLLAPLVKLGYV